MDEFEKVRDELLKKQLGADYKKFDMPRKNIPLNDDMGPLPTPPADVKKVKKEKTSVEVERKAKGGMIKSSASKRADGCATKGKTKGRII